MGEVYRARDPRLGRDVAIKVLPPAFSADADRLHRFEQEARAAAALNHPNILAVYDIGTQAGAPFIVSELLEGETLRERLNSGAVPVRKAIEQALQIARGLQAAHDKGITHRDLKPENIFITRDSRIKILDFGLAKLTQDQPDRATASALPTLPSPTQPGVVLGTVGYMAPEQVRGLSVDHRADLFAFGAIVYELLSSRRAFSRDTAPETMARSQRGSARARRSCDSILPALVRIVDRWLEKSVGRFQSATDPRSRSRRIGLVERVDRRERPHSTRRQGVRRLGAAALLLSRLGRSRISTSASNRLCRSHAVRDPSTVTFGGPGNFALSQTVVSWRSQRGRMGHAALDPHDGLARSPASSRFGGQRNHASAVLVAR
jgi:serine/threonine protein kinase